MKQLLFALLFSITCFGQGKMHLTAYRLIEEDADGPCSVKSYVKYQLSEYFSNYVTAESDDQELASRLLTIKEKARKGKSRKFYCFEGSFNGNMIHNMITIKSATITDTIFTDKDFLWVIFPDEEIAYQDKKQALKTALTGNIKDFFEYDFHQQLRAMFIGDNVDSIPLGTLLYRGRSGVVFIKNIEKDPQGYSFVRTDTAYGNVKKIYANNTDTIQIESDGAVLIISDPNTGWHTNMIKPGDPESKLITQYPASIKTPFFYHIRFEDIKRLHYYTIILKDGAGSIAYFIKDNKVEKIGVYLN